MTAELRRILAGTPQEGEQPVLDDATLPSASELAATNETRYRAIFDRAASGILLFDPSTRRVLDANPQAQRLVGASLDELRRRDVATIFDTPVSLEPGSDRDQPECR